MIEAIDRLFLERSVELAQRGLFSVTANPRVGCIVVKDGRVLGRGAHLRAGGPHAEIEALRAAGARVRGATAYVSLEPCSYAGRTPACTGALIDAGIARVVGAMSDPDPQVSGQGYAALERAGIEVDREELASARRLNYGHACRMRRGRPYVRVKIAQSLDGRTAMASGESQWITSPEARADVQYWRARSGAVMTGVGTVAADDPALTVRDQRFATAIDGAEPVLRQPLRVVADSALSTPRDALLLNDGQPTLLCHAAGSPARIGGESVELLDAPGAGGRVDLEALLGDLGRRGCNEVLVEAGSELVGALLAAGLWDELLVYVAPKLLGSSARPVARLALDRMSQAVGARIAAVANVGPDLRLRLVPSGRDPGELDEPPLDHPDSPTFAPPPHHANEATAGPTAPDDR